MARFPKAEAEVIALAQALVSGLTANTATYPAPPVLPAALTTLVSAYTTAKNTAIAAVAAAESATGIALSCYFKKFQKSLTAFSKTTYNLLPRKKHPLFDKFMQPCSI